MSIRIIFRPVYGHVNRRLQLFMLAFICLAVPLVVTAADELSLAMAERLALQSDPQIGAALARARAADQRATADSQLQDPKLSMGLFNVPLDNFDFNREPNTQLRFGVHQQFARGDTLTLKAQQRKWQSNAFNASAENLARTTLRDLRLNWFDVYYLNRAGHIIEENRSLFQQLLDTTENQYAAGRAYQQDVFRAQLELGLLDDRLAEMQRKERVSRGELSYWLKDVANRPLPAQLPELAEPGDATMIYERILLHPAVTEQTALMEASQRDVLIARERSHPQWTVGAEYRKRFGDDPAGSDRSDMLALVATVDLPLFRKNRQDRLVIAATEQASAIDLVRIGRVTQLQALLNRETSEREGLNSQLHLFTSRLLPDAAANSDAALRAYQSSIGDFPALIRAYSTELDLQLQLLRLQVDLARARARLLYLDPDAHYQLNQGNPLSGADGATS